jgi:competence protein CoiA
VQYALVAGTRQEASPGAKGACPTCGAAMVAKCGSRVIHHWAHASRLDCDPWWENETPWHRGWKALFPPDCREISHTAPDGEIHRSDIRTLTGIYIEVQHSAMSDAERLSREAFYGNLIWVLDGKPFKPNFDIYHELPDPRSDIAQDLVWVKAQRHMNGANAGLFFRLSECRVEHPDVTKSTIRGGIYHGIREIADEILFAYRGHHQYDWVRPRQTWLDAKIPVYIDFSEDYLLKMETYDESGLPCVRVVMKRDFVASVMKEADAKSVLKFALTRREAEERARESAALSGPGMQGNETR